MEVTALSNSSSDVAQNDTSLHRRQSAICIAEQTHVALARRTAVAIARDLGFGETRTEHAALIVSELASNLLKHAGGGELLLGRIFHDGIGGIEMSALDRGAGMENVGVCRRDGYSTIGTAGTGLGAIARLADFCQVFSRPDSGTALLARLWAESPPKRVNRRAEVGPLDIGSVCVPFPGEPVSGDAWAVFQRPGFAAIMLADGSGHGIFAQDAARKALEVFFDQPDEPPAEILAAAHVALKKTRGAAVAVAQIRVDEGEVRFGGVGNISAMLVEDSKWHGLVSVDGVAGCQMRTIHESTSSWTSETRLVMHSDGLDTHWRPDAYPALFHKDPALVAGVLYRDRGRRTDDMTVLVARSRRARVGGNAE